MNIDFLKQTGLSENEIQIYIFLLKTGSTTTGPIIRTTRISNSRVYESLNSLISKGLVAYSIHKEGKCFEAVDPRVLVEKEEEKINRIKSSLPQLLAIRNSEKPSTKTAIYEGFNGFKTAFKNIIDDCQENGTINIFGFSEQHYAARSLRSFIKSMNMKSARKKQKLRIVLDTSTRNTLGKDREKEKYVEVRYMPEGYMGPSAIDIFQDYVYMFLWEEKPFVFMIKNQKIADGFKQYFDFLWKVSKKR